MSRVRFTSQIRAVWLLILVGGTLTVSPSRVQAQVSLATVVDLAQRNSAEVRLAKSDFDKANSVLSESKDVFIPSVNFNTGLPVFPETGFTGNPPSIFGANVQSLVFSIPQKQYIDAARFGVRAATSRLKDAREQVALDASTAYIELDTVNRELEVARQQEGFGEQLVRIAQERAEAGVDSPNDLLDARLSAAQIRLRRLHLETRAATLSKQLSILTGLPEGSVIPDHASIPEIPEVKVSESHAVPAGINSAQLVARSKEKLAKGDQQTNYLPVLSFNAEYLRVTTLLNNVNNYFANPLPANNFASGISISVPLFDYVHRAKARESTADALRAKVEAEQAERQNELQIAQLTASLRELDTLAEIASLKQQIASNQLKSVQTQLELGNGPGPAPQLTPKAEQLAHIDERQRVTDAMDAGFDLAKARLGLLRALGHMDDWLHELGTKSN
jgi:outer membrane protein TolC